MIRYFDGMLTRRDLDQAAGAFAAALIASGFRRGDRVALYLQNVPQHLIAMIATWKSGDRRAINPMLRERELKMILGDTEASVLVALEHLYQHVAGRSAGQRAAGHHHLGLGVSVQTSPVLGGLRWRRAEGSATARNPASRGGSADPGLSVETSPACLHVGHHGPPKGGDDPSPQRRVRRPDLAEPSLSVPITQPGRGAAVPHHGCDRARGPVLATGAPLVLGYRFDPRRRWRPSGRQAAFTVGAITATRR